MKFILFLLTQLSIQQQVVLDFFMYPEYDQFYHNEKPIIGILTQPSSWKIYPSDEYSYISSSYVKAIESSGGRVVPIKYDLPQSNITRIIQNINGIYLTGGNTALDVPNSKTKEKSQYFKTAQFIIEQAKQINNNGEYFPVWGTSLGFECIIELQCPSDERQIINVINRSKPIHFFNIYQLSRLYSRLPDSIKSYLEKNNAMYFNNKHGYKINTLKCNFFNLEHLCLKDSFDILTYSLDNDGGLFTSSIESKNYPFYGVQFHPEKNPQQFINKVNHSELGIISSQYFSDFFISESKKNLRTFPSPQIEKKELINNYYPVQISDAIQSVYIFTKSGQKEIYRIASLTKKLHLNITKHTNSTKPPDNLIEKEYDNLSYVDDDQEFWETIEQHETLLGILTNLDDKIDFDDQVKFQIQ